MPATKFLFWNIGRKPLAPLVYELAEIHGVDVIILAECATDPGAMLQALNRTPETGYHFPPSLSQRTFVFTRFSREFLQPAFDSPRVSIRRLTLPARAPVLLATVHLPSKLHCSE
jgi:hypothetical protein